MIDNSVFGPPPTPVYQPEQRQPAPQARRGRRVVEGVQQRVRMVHYYEQLLNLQIFSDPNDPVAASIQEEICDFATRRILELMGQAPETTTSGFSAEEVSALKALAATMLSQEDNAPKTERPTLPVNRVPVPQPVRIVAPVVVQAPAPEPVFGIPSGVDYDEFSDGSDLDFAPAPFEQVVETQTPPAPIQVVPSQPTKRRGRPRKAARVAPAPPTPAATDNNGRPMPAPERFPTPSSNAQAEGMFSMASAMSAKRTETAISDMFQGKGNGGVSSSGMF